MQYYEKYVVIERLRKKVTCGEINLPYGTECYTIYHGDEKAIMCDKGLVCYISSKTAYKHFAQNDDGNGLERGRLTKSIIARLDRKEYDNGQHQKLWDKVWNDSICQKYKRSEYNDRWLWNYDFYNAPLFDLQYIAKLVGAKKKKKMV